MDEWDEEDFGHSEAAPSRPEAYVIVDSALQSLVEAHWRVLRVSEWDDSGRVFMALEHERGGVFDVVVDEYGPRLKPDADV